MKKLAILLPLLVLALATSLFAAEGQGDDPVFRAMQDELSRSMNRLMLPDMPKPYYMGYRLEDWDVQSIKARYGALTENSRERDRFLSIELRVGDSTMDNTNFIADWQDVFNMREGLIEEDEYGSIRHALWLHTDAAYKKALEQLARKKAFLQTHPVTESVADFSAAPRGECWDEPVALTLDASHWERSVGEAAAALNGYAALQDWNVDFVSRASNKRYLNSDGARHRKGVETQMLVISATTQAPDGQRLTAFLRYMTRDGDQPPTGDKLVADVKKMADELTAVAAAPVTKEYAGPVLFTDYAAAQLVSQLLIDELTPVRELVVTEDWMREYLAPGKLSQRLNRRVLPEFITVTDRPDLKEWKGQKLLGSQVVDDEGVPSLALTLVDKGRLVDLPMTRQPSKKIKVSNGHARALPNQWCAPSVTNVFIKSEKTVPQKALIEQLRTMAREFGNEYGLLITQMEESDISGDYRWSEQEQNDESELSAPVIAYKVYEKDGRMEPVRGLVFDDASVRSLRDVAVTGRDERVYSISQPVLAAQLRFAVSIETPSLLVEEMELKANEAREPMPVGSRPVSAAK